MRDAHGCYCIVRVWGKMCGDSDGVEFFYKNLGGYFRIAQPHSSKKALTPHVRLGVRMICVSDCGEQGLIVLGYRMGRVDRIVYESGRAREYVRDCNSSEPYWDCGVLSYV